MTAADRPYVVALGTAGGPRIWPESSSGHRRSGIATAVVVGDAVYLVDAGHGVFSQMARAGLEMSAVRGVFVTHLHSDHTIDLNNLILFGLFTLPDRMPRRIVLRGPGNRGVLPPVSSRASVPPTPVARHNPTAGIREMFAAFLEAYSTDLNDRILDGLRPSPENLFDAADIEIPVEAGFHPNDDPSPDMDPFEVYRDEKVVVTATLVVHPPIAPAFAFRFETTAGSVTISGDTRPSDNLVRLARDTDLLMHEAIDFAWVESTYAGRPAAVAQASIDHHRKSHTSPEQAGEIATRAGARTLLLHHLVPGNTPREVWERASLTFAGPLHIAEDLDVVPMRPNIALTAPGPAPAGVPTTRSSTEGQQR